MGRDFGLRELGFKAQLVGHTETGIATVIRDFIPARGTPEQLRRMLRHWMSAEEHAAWTGTSAEHLCSPAELGWGSHHQPARRAISMGGMRWRGKPTRAARSAAWSASNGRARTWRSSTPRSSATRPRAPPPDLPYGQFRVVRS